MQQAIEKHNQRQRVLLTPKLYRQLDLVARKFGTAIQVEPLKGGTWGKVEPLAQGLYEDLRDPSKGMLEQSLISVTNRINVNHFWLAKRPELDLSGIPRERIFEWVVYHEIGHLLHNYSVMDVYLNSADDICSDLRRWMWRASVVNEVLADRFAWETMFPGRQLPKSAFGVEFSEKVSGAMAEMHFRFGDPVRRTRAPLPTDELTMVPWRHIAHGVPLVRRDHRMAVETLINDAHAKWEPAFRRLRGLPDDLMAA